MVNPRPAAKPVARRAGCCGDDAEAPPDRMRRCWGPGERDQVPTSEASARQPAKTRMAFNGSHHDADPAPLSAEKLGGHLQQY